MAGVTDPIFRTICKELGVDVMVTEFVSAEGILQAWERNRRYTKIENAHRPIGIQLFGADGNHMGEAARIILDHEKPDFIDINFGCPVPKVVGKNGGSSLLKDLPLLASVAGGVVKAVGERIPVTAKIRIGWDFQSLCAMDACRLLENEGISMITIHGRTRSQQYSGTANWDIIDECARAMSVPVIGNGDISTPQAVAYVKENTAVSGVMIGRAAMENPWIFGDAKYYLLHGAMPPARDPQEKAALILRHARMALESRHYGDELHTMRHMRSRILAYTKGFPGAKEMRSRLVRVSSMPELEDLLSKLPAKSPENRKNPAFREISQVWKAAERGGGSSRLRTRLKKMPF
ncbi:tRNA dihydrouridine synthase DusB [Akkermansia muciniphila]|nr:tRNA dihydrouridine synthase DusB [Akkermansia muciniphila]